MANIIAQLGFRKSIILIWLITSCSRDQFSLGIDNYKKGDYEKAIILFSDALIKNPNDSVHIYEWRGYSYQKIGNYSSAIADLERCLSNSNSRYSLNINLGDCYAKIGDYRTALWYFHVAHSLDSISNLINNNIAISYFNLNLPDKALYFINNELKNNAENHEALLLKSDIFISLDLFDSSLYWVNKAISIERSSIAILVRCKANYGLQNYIEVYKDASYILGSSNPIPEAFYFRGLSYVRFDSIGKACEDFDMYYKQTNDTTIFELTNTLCVAER
jgi:tetratricopeptide (TPR) repeat protein